MGEHDEHRKRLRQNFLAVGFEGKSEHQILELLLTYAIPRIDVNPIAHELISKFGSLAEVFDANVEDLVKTRYITENGAVLLKMIPELFPVYSESKYKNKIKLDTYEKVKEYMIPKLMREKREVFYALCLDTHLNLIKAVLHTRGVLEEASINIRSFLNEVIKTEACQVILVHNHLSGSVEPSNADQETTDILSDALSHLSIRVIDHLIISGNACCSINYSKQYVPE